MRKHLHSVFRFWVTIAICSTCLETKLVSHASAAENAGPDLYPIVMLSGMIGLRPLVGRPVTMTLQLGNSGDVAAANFHIALYNGDPQNGGTWLADSVTITNAASKSVTPVPLSWVPTQAMTYSLHAWIDPDNMVQEINEANNTISTTIYVTEPNADLTVYPAFNVTSKLALGKKGTVKLSVANYGDISANDVTVAFYLDDPQSNGQLIGETKTISSVVNGKIVTVDGVITPTMVGTHTLYAWIDPANHIPEYIEWNNIMTRTVFVREADLTWYVNASANQSGDGRVFGFP